MATRSAGVSTCSARSRKRRVSENALSQRRGMAQVISAASSPARHQIVQLPSAFERRVFGKLGSAFGPREIVWPCADKIEIAEV